MKQYDHIILGVGQAAGTLLGKLIPTGERIAVIEKHKVGGTCVNYGCTPTKTLVATARAFHTAGRGDFYGFTSQNLKLDYQRVRARMDEIRNASRQGLRSWLEESDNVDFYEGEGRFTQAKCLAVNGEVLQGQRIYINTGTRPRIPEIDGLASIDWLDNAKLLEAEQLPEHLIILGGGYIGVEFAQIFRRFGSELTLIQRGDQLMPREDADVASSVQEILEKEGVVVHTGADATEVRKSGGRIQLHISKGGRSAVVEGSDLLVAIGRIPNSDGIGLDRAGVQISERGYITVDEHCQTNVPGVYALGDVNGKGAFTHTSVNDAEIALDHLCGGNRSLLQRIPVYALFTDPPLGRVGLTEKQALEMGKKVLTATRPMSEISRAKEMGETAGFAKLLVDADTDLILGASILGPGGDEIINMFAAIMHSGIPCREYRKVVLVHPTISELMPWILDGIREAKEDTR